GIKSSPVLGLLRPSREAPRAEHSRQRRSDQPRPVLRLLRLVRTRPMPSRRASFEVAHVGFCPEGAATYQPRATPWDLKYVMTHALKGPNLAFHPWRTSRWFGTSD